MKEQLEKLEVGKVLENVDIKDYTTYKVSCQVSYFVIPSSLEKLILLLQFLKEKKVKYKVIGQGSNLIFVSPKYEGVLIRLDSFSNLEIKKDRIVVGAGYSLMKLSFELANKGYSGFEFACGIPGSVGGAVFQNAGAYGKEISDIIRSITILTPDFKVEVWTPDRLLFTYRNSFLKRNPDYICLEMECFIEKKEKEEILEILKERRENRWQSQPIDYPSAGSVFRNPPGKSAWQLIESVGLKGAKIGGAEVSEKHANFIINKGGATGSDIKALIQKIKTEVKRNYNIELLEEQEYIE